MKTQARKCVIYQYQLSEHGINDKHLYACCIALISLAQLCVRNLSCYRQLHFLFYSIVQYSFYFLCLSIDSCSVYSVGMVTVTCHTVRVIHWQHVISQWRGVHRDWPPLHTGIGPDGRVNDKVPDDLDPRRMVRQAVVKLRGYLPYLKQTKT